MSRIPTVLFIQASEAGAYPPLINAATLFSRAGWRTVFLSAPVIDQTMALPNIPGMALEEIRPRPSHIMGKTAYAEYCRRSVALSIRFKPDVVYCSDAIGALPGLMAAAVGGSRLIYHEHDSPNMHTDLRFPVRMSRRAAARRAYLVVLPNADRAAKLCSELVIDPSRVRIVWNAPLRDEVARSIQPRPSSRFWLHYHGSINPDRLPQAVVEAAAEIEGVGVRIVGYETSSGRGHVRRLIERFGSAANGGKIDWVGEKLRGELLAIAMNGDVGLALVPLRSDDTNLRHMTGASNKIFDYMAAGLPAIVSDLPDWNEMFVRPGHAVAADPEDVESLKGAIRSLVDAPDLAASMGRRNREKILTEWNYETQFAPVLDALLE